LVPVKAAVPLVIIGAGGLGRELIDLVEAVNAVERRFQLLGFVDDGSPDEALLQRRGTRLLGPIRELARIDAVYVIGIGAPTARKAIDELMTGTGRRAATLVHPSAVVGGENRLGEGTVICSHVSVTTNVSTGRHVQLHVNCTVGHDAALASYVTVLPGATVAGRVVLEEGVTVGTNAAVIQGIRVGALAIVGAGAAVVRDVAAGVTAVGVPARPVGEPGEPAGKPSQ